jgi:peptidoglycan/xylan/chitin deacetylase (PgdA/CDA1 family)
MGRASTSCVMLHTVGIPDPRWKWYFLTIPWRIFDAQLHNLRRLGYRTVHLTEYMDVALSGKLEKERVVSLTFDDGYLDNWVFAAPLLEKYGFKGTVFMSTDFTDPTLEPRPQLNLASGGDNMLPRHGFLSWEEMRRLDSTGVLEVQAHLTSHTWYPSGPDIVDFRHPGDQHYWMDWNRIPQHKYHYLDLPQDSAVWGAPVYAHAKALDGPRYFPDERVAVGLREHVAERGLAFFDNPEWRSELATLSTKLQGLYQEGYHETYEEYLTRVRGEMIDSKTLIEKHLDKKVDFLCWPGGGYNQEVFDMAAEFYVGTTVGSRERTRPAAMDRLKCFRFSRIAPPAVWGRKGFRYTGPWQLPLLVEENRAGNKAARLIRGGSKVLTEKWENLKSHILGPYKPGTTG